MKNSTPKAFLEAFSKLKQRVLWKWENDSLPGQSSNLKLGKWLPQSDILGELMSFFAYKVHIYEFYLNRENFLPVP
jgi:hypothetical protein